MDNDRLDEQKAARALVALAELRSALQEAHFAARLLEEVMPPAPADRPADRIHALRMDAGRLAGEIEVVLRAYREVDLRSLEATA
jgi:hypothetical protein